MWLSGVCVCVWCVRGGAGGVRGVGCFGCWVLWMLGALGVAGAGWGEWTSCRPRARAYLELPRVEQERQLGRVELHGVDVRGHPVAHVDLGVPDELREDEPALSIDRTHIHRMCTHVMYPGFMLHGLLG